MGGCGEGGECECRKGWIFYMLADSLYANVDRNHAVVCIILGVLCSVCKEDFTAGESLLKLPCKHLYHKDCVIPWLELVCEGWYVWGGMCGMVCVGWYVGWNTVDSG